MDTGMSKHCLPFGSLAGRKKYAALRQEEPTARRRPDALAGAVASSQIPSEKNTIPKDLIPRTTHHLLFSHHHGGLKNLSAAMRMQYLGLLSNQNDGNQTNHVFTIELDTFQNWELQDMNDNHVGIDVNSLRSIQSHDAGFYHDKNGTFQSLSLDSQEVMQLWVDYHGEKMQINATMAPLGMAKPNDAAPFVSFGIPTPATLPSLETTCGKNRVALDLLVDARPARVAPRPSPPS